MSLLPVFSAYDPAVEGEGSLDPLGLEAGAERLAELLLPGVTARMHRVRALTVLAVSAHVAGPYLNEYTADQTTPAWLVVEWMYAEALAVEGADATNIPGIQTARRVREGGGHLAARVYLKSPVALGLHGFYRRLANAGRVLEESGDLGENGDPLVRAWERDQGLQGFLDEEGEGGRRLKLLRDALEKSLAKSRVAVGRRTDAISTFRWHLMPGFEYARCTRERRELRRILDEDPSRAETIKLLEQHLERGGQGDSEPDLAEWLRKRGSARVKADAAALIAYERVAGILTEAFDLARWISSQDRGRALEPPALVASRHKELVDELRPAVLASREAEAEIEHGSRRVALLTHFDAVTSPTEFVEKLLERHDEVQRGKGREGKRPWFERTERGVAIRAAYAVGSQPTPNGGFIHPTRLSNACEFLEELG